LLAPANVAPHNLAAVVQSGIAVAPVSAPTNFTGTALSGTVIELKWSGVAGATGFKLYQFQNGQPVQIGTFDASATTTNVPNLTPGTTYAFNLVAFNASSTAATPWIGITTPFNLAAPGNFTATPVSNSEIALSWISSTGATGYRLYQFTNNQPTLIATYAFNVTSASITGLTINTAYAFNLVAVRDTTTAATPWVGATTLATPSVPPDFTAVAISGTQARLDWAISYGATGYRLFQTLPGQQPVQVAQYTATTTSAVIGGLLNNTTYSFNLVAFNNSGTATTPLVAVTTGGPVLAPNTFFGNAQSNSQINLYWSFATGATGYKLYEFLNGQPVLLKTYDGNTTSAVVSGLKPATTYAFNLVAFNAVNSAATKWIGVTTAV